jgi:hypothetical protein
MKLCWTFVGTLEYIIFAHVFFFFMVVELMLAIVELNMPGIIIVVVIVVCLGWKEDCNK